MTAEDLHGGGITVLSCIGKSLAGWDRRVGAGQSMKRGGDALHFQFALTTVSSPDGKPRPASVPSHKGADSVGDSMAVPSHLPSFPGNCAMQ